MQDGSPESRSGRQNCTAFGMSTLRLVEFAASNQSRAVSTRFDGIDDDLVSK